MLEHSLEIPTTVIQERFYYLIGLLWRKTVVPERETWLRVSWDRKSREDALEPTW